MVLELKSVTASPQSPFILKGGLFALALLGYRFSPNGLFSFFIFVAAFIIYALPFFHTRRYLVEFLTLTTLGFSIIKIVPTGYVLPTAFFFGFFFYVLVALKNVLFVNRSIWQHALTLGLIYSLSALFFYRDNPVSFGGFLYYLVIIFLLHRLLKGAFTTTLVSGLLMIELVWLLAKLPLGFVNAASLTVVSAHTLSVLFGEVFKDGQSITKKALVITTAFVAVLLLVFFNTAWHLPVG